MKAIHRHGPRLLATALVTLLTTALSPSAARADVTVEQQTTLDAGAVEIDIATVERTSADKQRRDSTTQCHGFLALLCGNAQSGQIVRLDKQLEWQLQPKKKLYTERAFPTAEQRAQAQQKLQQALEEMKKCQPPGPQAQPTAQGASGPDTSHCQLSAPTVAVDQTGEHATVAGHDARKTTVVLSQTCTDQQTGDVCEIDYGFDLWLTADDLPGSAERRAFEQHYLAAQGLDQNNPQLQGAVQQFMAPYAATLRQLQVKASDLKGYPLRTVFFMAFGGPHCGRAKQAQQSASTAPPGSGGIGFKRLASDAVGGRLAGLFSHRGADATTSADAGQVGANATAQAADAGATSGGTSGGAASGGAQASATSGTTSPMVRVVSMSTEVKSIDTAPITPQRFEIPADWNLQPPAPQRAEQGPSCPVGGH